MKCGRIVLIFLNFLVACDTSSQTNQLASLKLKLGSPISEVGVDDEIAEATWATRTTNGKIYVADQFDHNLKVFSAAGKLERVVGREGSGPGEFRAPVWVGRCTNDSLFVYDGLLRRIAVYNLEGEFIRQFAINAGPGLSCNSGLIAYMQPVLSESNNPQRQMYRHADLVITDVTGTTLSRVENLVLGNEGPLAIRANVAVGDNWVAYGLADTSKVQLYTPTGKRKKSFDFREKRRLASKEILERQIEEVLSTTGHDKIDQEATRSFWAQIPQPKYLPVYTSLLHDRGKLWAVLTVLADSITRVRSLSQSGDIESEFIIPSRINVFEIGRGYLLASYYKDGRPVVGMWVLPVSNDDVAQR